jgi:hypothetical protein
MIDIIIKFFIQFLLLEYFSFIKKNSLNFQDSLNEGLGLYKISAVPFIAYFWFFITLTVVSNVILLLLISSTLIFPST